MRFSCQARIRGGAACPPSAWGSGSLLVASCILRRLVLLPIHGIPATAECRRPVLADAWSSRNPAIPPEETPCPGAAGALVRCRVRGIPLPASPTSGFSDALGKPFPWVEISESKQRSSASPPSPWLSRGGSWECPGCVNQAVPPGEAWGKGEELQGLGGGSGWL